MDLPGLCGDGGFENTRLSAGNGGGGSRWRVVFHILLAVKILFWGDVAINQRKDS